MKHVKPQILAKLANEITPEDIAKELNVGLSSVLRVKVEFDDAVRSGTINKLLDMDDLALSEISSQLVTTKEIGEAVQGVVEDIKPLQRLQTDLIDTATVLNNRLRVKITTLDTIEEMRTASVILADLQKSFFNDAQTQINIQNNYGGESNGTAYGEFLNDKPGTIQ